MFVLNLPNTEHTYSVGSGLTIMQIQLKKSFTYKYIHTYPLWKTTCHLITSMKRPNNWPKILRPNRLYSQSLSVLIISPWSHWFHLIQFFLLGCLCLCFSLLFRFRFCLRLVFGRLSLLFFSTFVFAFVWLKLAAPTSALFKLPLPRFSFLLPSFKILKIFKINFVTKIVATCSTKCQYICLPITTYCHYQCLC